MKYLFVLSVLFSPLFSYARCDYPDDLDSAGRRCGKRAASVRPGGRLGGDGSYNKHSEKTSNIIEKPQWTQRRQAKRKKRNISSIGGGMGIEQDQRLQSVKTGKPGKKDWIEVCSHTLHKRFLNASRRAYGLKDNDMRAQSTNFKVFQRDSEIEKTYSHRFVRSVRGAVFREIHRRESICRKNQRSRKNQRKKSGITRHGDCSLKASHNLSCEKLYKRNRHRIIDTANK